MTSKGRITISANKENLEKFKKMCGLTPYSRILDRIIDNTIAMGNINDNSMLMSLPESAMKKVRKMCAEQGKTIPEIIVDILEENGTT